MPTFMEVNPNSISILSGKKEIIPLPKGDPREVIPLPPSDPRGSSFRDRLPKEILQYHGELLTNPYGPMTMPTDALLYSKGISQNADKEMVTSPLALMQRYLYPDSELPESYGVGKNKIYTPKAQDPIGNLLDVLSSKKREVRD